MSEVLVRAAPAYNPDPLLSLQPGDFVDAKPDGFQWGTEERPPKFVVLHIPGMALANLADRMESLDSRRRRYSLDPVVVQAALDNGGVLQMKRNELMKALIDHGVT